MAFWAATREADCSGVSVYVPSAVAFVKASTASETRLDAM